MCMRELRITFQHFSGWKYLACPFGLAPWHTQISGEPSTRLLLFRCLEIFHKCLFARRLPQRLKNDPRERHTLNNTRNTHTQIVKIKQATDFLLGPHQRWLAAGFINCGIFGYVVPCTHMGNIGYGGNKIKSWSCEWNWVTFVTPSWAMITSSSFTDPILGTWTGFRSDECHATLFLLWSDLRSRCIIQFFPILLSPASSFSSLILAFILSPQWCFVSLRMLLALLILIFQISMFPFPCLWC